MKPASGQGSAGRQAAQARTAQEAHLVELWRAGTHTSTELAGLFCQAALTGRDRIGWVAKPTPGCGPTAVYRRPVAQVD